MKVRKFRRTSLVFAVVLAAGLLAGPGPIGSAQEFPPPAFDKSFSPSTIGPGSTATLTFVIDNSDNPANPADNLAFTDNLPAAVTIADPPSVDNGCDGVVSAPADGGTISLTGGKLGGGAICTISVNVTASDFGEGSETHTNTSGDLTSSLGNSGTATADLTVDAGLPGFSKTFTPATIPLGAKSTLTFLIDNTNNGAAESPLSFADQLPADMVVASPTGASHTCGFGGSVSTGPGPGQINFAGGSVGAGSTCTVSVKVTTVARGTFDNVSGPLTVGSSGTEAGFATATLTVPLNTLNKTFLADPVPPGGEVTLQFLVQNPSRTETATGLTFTDALPAGLSLASGPDPDPPCGAGSSLTGSTTLTFAGGTLAPEASCTFTVVLDVPPGATPGTYTNTTSAITGSVGGEPLIGPAASDDVSIELFPLFTKSFTDDPAAAGGTVTLEFSLTNTTSTALDLLEFTDDLDTVVPGLAANVLVDGDVEDPVFDVCGTGSKLTVNDPPDLVVPPIVFPADPTKLEFSGGSLAAAGSPGDSCTFSVELDVPAGSPSGAFPNTTSDLTGETDPGGTPITGPPATDDLIIIGGVTLSKEFLNDPVFAGTSVDLEFTITNPSDEDSATGIGFTDDLTFLTDLTASSPPDPDPPCGVGSSLTTDVTDTLITFAGGSLDPGESCTFTVTLSVPADAPVGDHTNTTSDVSATVAGVTTLGEPAEDVLTVSPLSFSKSFTDDPVKPGDSVTLEFTISLDSSSPTSATSIAFFDDLDVTDPPLTTSGLPLNDACDPDGPGGDPGTGSLSVSGGALSFSGGSLDAGESCTFSVTLGVPSGVEVGTYLNTTRTSNDESPAGISATIDSTTVFGPKATDTLVVELPLAPLLTKEFTDDPVTPGDTVTLEFTVTNSNLDDAMTSIAFDDVLTDALAGLAGIPPPDPDPPCGAGSSLTGSTTLSLTGGALPAGGSCTFSVPVTVPGGAGPGSYLNTTTAPTALVNGIGVTGDAASDTLDVVSSTPSADLAITKTDDADPTTSGATVTYTVTVTNNGPELATSVVVTDTLPPGLAFVSTSGCENDPAGVPSCNLAAVLGAGDSEQFTITATVTAPAGTVLSNTATVSSDTPDPDPDNNSATEETLVGAFCNGLLGTIYGTSGDDMLMGTPGPDVIIAFAGNDRIYGFAGDDTICAGSGDDTIIGGLDDDTIFGQAGVDTVAYTGAPSGVTVDLGLGVATGGDGTDTISSVRNATGSSHDDTLFGNALANVLRGENGNDFLDGRAGNDLLLGGNGNDVLRGRAGDDVKKGGPGTDTASYQLAPVGVTINLLIVGPQATGVGSDTLASIENVIGSKFGDTIEGNAQANTFIGMNGNDILRGRSGNDFLIGGSGFDSGVGGNGFDTCLTENQITCEAP